MRDSTGFGIEPPEAGVSSSGLGSAQYYHGGGTHSSTVNIIKVTTMAHSDAPQPMKVSFDRRSSSSGLHCGKGDVPKANGGRRKRKRKKRQKRAI